MSSYGGRVCSRCLGRGIVYDARGQHVCPRCLGARSSRSADRWAAVEKLKECWTNRVLGHTGDFNVELAVRGCLAVGLSIEQLQRRTGIARAVLRRAESGQGLLL